MPCNVAEEVSQALATTFDEADARAIRDTLFDSYYCAYRFDIEFDNDIEI